MNTEVKMGWSNPSTILFACEVPANQRALSFAVAQARQLHAKLILLHVYDTLVVSASDPSGIRYCDAAAASGVEKQHLEPVAEQIREEGLECEVAVRSGLAADQILCYAREREIDRIVVGAHSPGPVGKLLVGSVAEAVLRRAAVPVCIVGPEAGAEADCDYQPRTILCAANLAEPGRVVAGLAAELAAQHNARLVLQHVIRPQDRAEALAGRSLDEVEAELLALVPPEIQDRIEIETVVVPGDPTEELLYQSRAQNADLIVLGAQGASAFAAITRHGVVYKTLAQAHCPVITLSPVVLAACGAAPCEALHAEAYMAGVF